MDRHPETQFPYKQIILKKDFIPTLWVKLTQSHPGIQEQDQRRLATLLSALLLGFIALASVLEIITVTLITWTEEYTGYRQTIVVVILLFLVYWLSRTRYYRVAAALMILIASGGIFWAALSEPAGITGGLLDYLIIPIWLGSMFFLPGQLIFMVLVNLVALLLIPIITPTVNYNLILIGPVGFLLVVSVPLFLMIHARNLLEQDRRIELLKSEHRYRQEAARAQALLRVASRINSQLDLDALLFAICEEIAKALETPIALIYLFDVKQNGLFPAACIGLSQEDERRLPSFSRDFYEQGLLQYGTVFELSDLQEFIAEPGHEIFRELEVHSLALANMEHEKELIGFLAVLTTKSETNFSEDQLLLLQGLADQAALAIIKTRLYKDARRRLENLQALRAIDIAIVKNHDLKQTLDVLVKQITRLLEVDAAVVLLLDPTREYLEYAASKGYNAEFLVHRRLRIGEGTAGLAAESSSIFQISDLQSDPMAFIDSPLLKQEKMRSYFAAPLIVKDQVIGVLELFRRTPFDPDDEWFSFLKAFAGQAAIAIDNSTLFHDLQRSNQELSQAYDATIEGWSRALDLRDKETVGHTIRVTEMTLHLARLMKFDPDKLTHVRRGALLHDIGKMGIPDAILLKPGPLTDEEWEIMRRHPVYAYELLRPIEYLRPALEIPYYHHEKWDGTGYPLGLKGEEIPLAARIFAIVDVWDALSSDRPYRKGWPPERVYEHIRSQSDTHFDPQIAELFLKLLKSRS